MMPAEWRLAWGSALIAALCIAIEFDRPRLSPLAMLICDGADADEVSVTANAINAMLYERGVGTGTGIVALALCLWHANDYLRRQLPEGGGDRTEAAIVEVVREFLRTYSV